MPTQDLQDGVDALWSHLNGGFLAFVTGFKMFGGRCCVDLHFVTLFVCGQFGRLHGPTVFVGWQVTDEEKHEHHMSLSLREINVLQNKCDLSITGIATAKAFHFTLILQEFSNLGDAASRGKFEIVENLPRRLLPL